MSKQKQLQNDEKRMNDGGESEVTGPPYHECHNKNVTKNPSCPNPESHNDEKES